VPPTIYLHQYYATASGGGDLLTISSYDSFYINSPCNPSNTTAPGVCAVTFVVRAFSALTVYTVVAEASAATVLATNTALLGSATGNTTRQYVYQVNYHAGEVSRPVLGVSCQHALCPTVMTVYPTRTHSHTLCRSRYPLVHASSFSPSNRPLSLAIRHVPASLPHPSSSVRLSPRFDV
jgi:hypothetical protein